MPNYVNWVVIGYQDWKETLLSRYTYIMENLSYICHGCGNKKYLQSKLPYTVGDLINIHHDEVVRYLGHHIHLYHLFSRVFSESLITPYCIYVRGREHPVKVHTKVTNNRLKITCALNINYGRISSSKDTPTE